MVAGSEFGATVHGRRALRGVRLVTILGQTRVTAWCAPLGPGRSLTRGLARPRCAFVPLLAAEAVPIQRRAGGAAAVGSPRCARRRGARAGHDDRVPLRDGHHRRALPEPARRHPLRLYNTICGVGILLGNLGTGWALDLARSAGLAPAPWAVMLLLGLLCAAALAVVRRRGLLTAHTDSDDPRPDAEALTVRLPAIDGWAEQSAPTRPLPARAEPRGARTMRPVRISAAPRTEHDEPSSPRGRHARRE